MLPFLWFEQNQFYPLLTWGKHSSKYIVGSRSFRPDIQKPRQMENAVSVEKCVEIKGDYVEK